MLAAVTVASGVAAAATVSKFEDNKCNSKREGRNGIEENSVSGL